MRSHFRPHLIFVTLLKTGEQAADSPLPTLLICYIKIPDLCTLTGQWIILNSVKYLTQNGYCDQSHCDFWTGSWPSQLLPHPHG